MSWNEIDITGVTNYRKSLFGKMVLRVQIMEIFEQYDYRGGGSYHPATGQMRLQWRDATELDLTILAIKKATT